MTEEFTASNGLKIVPDYEHGGVKVIDSATGDNMFEDMPWIGHEDGAALAEYYRAKEDERLGRWRWPENPDWVLYPDEDGDVTALNEITGESSSLITRITVANFSNTPDCKAAAAYFDAHPEPKPWHDAKEGEVWELDFKAGAHAWFVNGAYFQSTKTLTNIYKTDSDILSARRIYPEYSND